MSGERPSLCPEPAGRGLASIDPAEIADLVTAAWDGAVELANQLDLDVPSRLPGWSVRDVLVHLGSWPEHTRFDRMVDDVRLGRVPDRDDVDARNAFVVAAHADAGRDEIVAALTQARDSALTFLTSPDAERLGRRTAWSRLGPLPLTCVLAASAFELAVHALDVTTPDTIPDRLLHAGVGTLVDTTGALATRAGISTRVAVITPIGGWTASCDERGWSTMPVDGALRVGDLGWPSLQGEAADILDAASGRRSAVQLALTRRLRLTDLPRLMTVLPALESVPGLPGGAATRATTRALARTGSLVSRIGMTIRGTS